jgi:hypothetical protein
MHNRGIALHHVVGRKRQRQRSVASAIHTARIHTRHGIAARSRVQAPARACRDWGGTRNSNTSRRLQTCSVSPGAIAGVHGRQGWPPGWPLGGYCLDLASLQWVNGGPPPEGLCHGVRRGAISWGNLQKTHDLSCDASGAGISCRPVQVNACDQARGWTGRR